jgi:hypothetical protein
MSEEVTSDVESCCTSVAQIHLEEVFTPAGNSVPLGNINRTLEMKLTVISSQIV